MTERTEYAFLRDEHASAGDIHLALQAKSIPVEAVTVAGHTIPPTVFVRCLRALTEEELDVCRTVAEGHTE